jgi:RHS repeat-associated protein
VQESFSVTYVTEKNQFPSSDGYQYDAAGNLTSASGMGSYTYDAENRMTATAGVTYTYDGDGRRVQKSNGKLYWYGASGLDALLETDLAGNSPTEYIFYGGKRAARRDPSGSVFYYFANHLGSANVVTNSSAAIVDESDYYPFGGERLVVNSDPNHYKFTGKERDTESNLDYFGARFFSSTQGRFASVDPFSPILELDRDSPDEEEAEEAKQKFNEYLGDPQNWNRYTYVLNRPKTHIDSDGRVPIPVIILVAARLAPVAGAIAARYGPQVLRTLQSAGPAISQRIHSLGPAVRGGIIELMQGSPNSWRYVQGIDNFVRGRAISIKSMDIVFSRSYQSASAIISRLSGYVDRLANYAGGSTPAGQITANQIKERILQVVLPRGQLTAEQLKALGKVVEEAAKKGVKVEIYQIK